MKIGVQNKVKNLANTRVFKEDGLLFEVYLFKLRKNKSFLFINIDHMIFDGWSLGIFNKQLSHLYNYFLRVELDLPAFPDAQYHDYVQWQEDNRSSASLSADISYWQGKLAYTEATMLPTDFDRPIEQRFSGNVRELVIEKSICDEMLEFIKLHETTIFGLLHACFNVLLYNVSFSEDQIVGVPFANRMLQRFEKTLGYFVNMLPLRTNINGQSKFTDILRENFVTLLDAINHQSLSYSEIIKAINPKRKLSAHPLVAVVFAFQNATTDFLSMHGLQVTSLPVNYKYSRFDLEWHVWLTESNTLRIEAIYNDKLFIDKTIEQFLRLYKAILVSVLADPCLPICQVPCFDVLRKFNVVLPENVSPISMVGFNNQRNVVSAFLAQVDKNPQGIAVKTLDGNFLTYFDLSNEAQILAKKFLQLNICSGKTVALYLKRGINYVVSILAVLMSGAAYVPIEINQPRSRINKVLEQAMVSLFIYDDTFQSNETFECCRCVSIDFLKNSRTPPLTLNSDIEPKATAYILFTSGTTGEPKGVAVLHDGIISLIANVYRKYVFDGNDKWSLVHSFGFDYSVWELFGAILTGGTSVMFSEEAVREPELFCRAIREQKITVLNQTPMAFANFTNYYKQLNFADHCLRWICLAGEKCSISVFHDWLQHEHGREIVYLSVYGVTECVVLSTFYEVDRRLYYGNCSPIIGKALPDQVALVLNPNSLQITPVGEIGELYIGGRLSAGYFDHGNIVTQGRFIEYSINGKKLRLYKTGDLVREMIDGNLIFIRRIDTQHKLSGFRIELSEIEHQLELHPKVAAALVIPHPEQRDKLGAFIVPKKTQTCVEGREKSLHAWKQVFENLYQSRMDKLSVGDFRVNGWFSSYTNLPIDDNQMAVWIADIAEKICMLQPTNILEIGCGSGLLLSKVISACQSYVGIDISQNAIDVARNTFSKFDKLLRFICGDVFSVFEAVDLQAIDTIIINSVVQYFPDLNYLDELLEQLIHGLPDCACIFLGDIRNLHQFAFFNATLVNYLHEYKLTGDEYRNALKIRMRQEKELLIDPCYFLSLIDKYSGEIDVLLLAKNMKYCNELSCFRYDVVISRKKFTDQITLNVREYDCLQHDISDSTLVEMLESNGRENTLFYLQNVPNKSLKNDFIYWRKQTNTSTICDLQKSWTEFCTLDEKISELGWKCISSPSCFGDQASYDILFYVNNSSGISSSILAYLRQWQYKQYLKQDYRAHANTVDQDIVNIYEMQQHLSQQLPYYMIPTMWRFLDQIPLNNSGKTNKVFLEELLLRGDLEFFSYIAPGNELESKLCKAWAKVLKLDAVSVCDRFFDLGGDSILSIHLLMELKKEGFVLELRELYQYQTVASLAKYLVKREKDPTSGHSSLISITEERDSLPTMFLIHPIGGHVQWYRDLGNLLNGHYSVFALEDPCLSSLFEIYDSLEEKAGAYIDIIKGKQKFGPYHIAGWSFGAYMSFEISKQLIARGDEVLTTALIDPVREDNIDNLIGDEEMLFREFVGDIVRRHGKTTAIEKTFSKEDCYNQLLNLRGLSLSHEEREKYFAQIDDVFCVYRHNLFLLKNYKPQGAIGWVTLFLSNQIRYDAADFWQKHCRKLDVCVLEGDHYEIVRQPVVKIVATTLAEK